MSMLIFQQYANDWPPWLAPAPSLRRRERQRRLKARTKSTYKKDKPRNGGGKRKAKESIRTWGALLLF